MTHVTPFAGVGVGVVAGVGVVGVGVVGVGVGVHPARRIRNRRNKE